jgi:hypothetical protein
VGRRTWDVGRGTWLLPITDAVAVCIAMTVLLKGCSRSLGGPSAPPKPSHQRSPA